MPADIIDFERVRQARVPAEQAMQQQTQQEGQEQPGMLARAALAMRGRRTQQEIKKLTKELEHWRAEAEANERKKNTCMLLMIFALGDDLVDVFGALVSFGLLPTITFPIPGIIRMLVAANERESKPDRMLRAIAAMAIEAIPVINVLPTTTINLCVDYVEAYWDAESAKKNVESREKKIKQLKTGMRAQSQSALSRIRTMAQRAA